MKTKIQTWYRLQIEVRNVGEATPDWEDKIRDYSFKITHNGNVPRNSVEWSCYQGPIFDFGIKLESEDRVLLAKVGKKIENYVGRFKDLEIVGGGENE